VEETEDVSSAKISARKSNDGERGRAGSGTEASGLSRRLPCRCVLVAMLITLLLALRALHRNQFVIFKSLSVYHSASEVVNYIYGHRGSDLPAAPSPVTQPSHVLLAV